ncbi:MAG: hypothetical protein BWZ10_00487 [candidate division BRC1 bacterium ADurb.BinA364]|nr:MAG: hypothetical protein BWZ10_00487 [candidate division BRC1 bacterium ADurb.BinA364]
MIFFRIALVCCLFSMEWVAALAAAPTALELDPARSTGRPAPLPTAKSRPVIGLSDAGAGYPSGGVAGDPKPETLEALLTPVLSNKARMLWQIRDGRWPVSFAMERLCPGGDPDSMFFAATDMLVRFGARAECEIVPLLAPGDLARLGKADPAADTLGARTLALARLAERYDGDGLRDMPEPRGRISAWMLESEWLRLAPEALAEETARLAADAGAIQLGNQSAAIFVALGDVSTGSSPDVFGRIAELASGPARSQFHGIAAEAILEHPSMEEIAALLDRLRDAARGLPVWLSGIRIGAAFQEGLPDSAFDGDWTRDRAAAAYVSAAALHAVSLTVGGAVFFDQAPTPEFSPPLPRFSEPSAADRAGGALAALLPPFYRARRQLSGNVWEWIFDYEARPEARAVFWDWAAAGAFDSSATMEHCCDARADLYRADPLVPGAEPWSAEQTIVADKIGLILDLGFSPVFVRNARYLGDGLDSAPPAEAAPLQRNAP